MMAKFLHIILLILVSGGIYANSLQHKFVWDDPIFVTGNKYIKSYQYIPEYFSDNFCSGGSSYKDCPFYRPIVLLSYFADYSIWGLNPFGFHLTNIIIHIIVTVLVYLTGLYLFRNQLPALLAGLFFAIHPIHTESVNAVFNRTDPPTAIFFLLSFLSFIYYLKHTHSKNSRYYVLSLLFFAVSLLTKEIAITLPVILYTYESMAHAENKKGFSSRIIRYLPYLLMIVGYFILRKFALGYSLNKELEYQDLYNRLLTAPLILIAYIKLLLYPVNLSVYHAIPTVNSILEKKMLIGLLQIGVITIFMIWAYYRSRDILFLSSWVVITFIPVLNLVPSPSGSWNMAERFSYIPSIGLCMILGTVIVKFIESNKIKTSIIVRHTALITLSLILIFLSIITIKRNLIWKDDYTLWSETVKKEPHIFFAHHNLGNVYAGKGLLDQAIIEFKEALKINPNYILARFGLGTMYMKKGLLDQAITEYKEVIRINPNYIQAYNNLGTIYVQKGLFDQAIMAYKEAIRINPDNAKAHNNLGLAYDKKGLLDQAIMEYKEAVRIDPAYAEAHYNLGNAYLDKGLADEATAELNEARRIKPKLFLRP